MKKKVKPSIPSIPWSDLTSHTKITALQYMSAGVFDSVTQTIKTLGARRMQYCLIHGIDFTPESVWDQLSSRMQNHFVHCQQVVDHINRQIIIEKSKINLRPDATWDHLIDDDDSGEEVDDESQ